jgi:hypothetical protein
MVVGAHAWSLHFDLHAFTVLARVCKGPATPVKVVLLVQLPSGAVDRRSVVLPSFGLGDGLALFSSDVRILIVAIIVFRRYCQAYG